MARFLLSQGARIDSFCAAIRANAKLSRRWLRPIPPWRPLAVRMATRFYIMPRSVAMWRWPIC